jgi:hypothetical protein
MIRGTLNNADPEDRDNAVITISHRKYVTLSRFINLSNYTETLWSENQRLLSDDATLRDGLHPLK